MGRYLDMVKEALRTIHERGRPPEGIMGLPTHGEKSELSEICHLGTIPGGEVPHQARAIRRAWALADFADDPALRYTVVPDETGDPVMLTIAVRDIPKPGRIAIADFTLPRDRWRPLEALRALSSGGKDSLSTANGSVQATTP